jgi:uncharacterized protein
MIVHSRPFASCALCAVATAGLLAAATGPVKLSPVEAASVVREIQKERAATQTWLRTDPTSYLATVDRLDFAGKRMLTIGRAASNDLRIDAADVQPRHLRVTVEGDRFRVERLDAAATFAVESTPGTFQAVTSGTTTLGPGSVKIGRWLLRLSHQGFPGIIVFDPKSPRFALYKGLEYFPPDLSYRYELPLTPNPKPETVVIMSTRGNQRRATRVGWFEFMVGNQAARLEALRLLEPGVGENDINVFFRDATSGKESYELGRYVDVRKMPDGRYLLDFNAAYNPACAYSVHYNCPIPPKSNVLPMALRAGEMDSHYH